MNPSAKSDETCSSTESSATAHEEVLNSVRQLLKNQVFSGRFEERRLIEIGSVSMYKDIIVINDSEHEFKKVLGTVNDTLKNHFQENIITCISASRTKLGISASYSIWTNLNGVTLGSHWFQVKNISLCGDIIHLSLKSLRSLKEEHDTSETMDFSKFIADVNFDCFKKGLTLCWEYVTLENVVSFSRFMIALLITFSICCYHLLELLLRGVKEVNVFVHNITPVLVACVDGITKIVGGFFILIAMMWNSIWGGRGFYSPPPSIYAKRSLMENPINEPIFPTKRKFEHEKSMF